LIPANVLVEAVNESLDVRLVRCGEVVWRLSMRHGRRLLFRQALTLGLEPVQFVLDGRDRCALRKSLDQTSDPRFDGGQLRRSLPSCTALLNSSARELLLERSHEGLDELGPQQPALNAVHDALLDDRTANGKPVVAHAAVSRAAAGEVVRGVDRVP